MYLFTAVVGLEWWAQGESMTGGQVCTNCDAAPLLFIPIAGPFIAIPEADGTDGKAIAGVMGGLQIAGFCVLVAGIVKTAVDKHREREADAALEVSLTGPTAFALRF
jgi:hypothetical protein